jgi:hypothetical protein
MGLGVLCFEQIYGEPNSNYYILPVILNEELEVGFHEDIRYLLQKAGPVVQAHHPDDEAVVARGALAFSFILQFELSTNRLTAFPPKKRKDGRYNAEFILQRIII